MVGERLNILIPTSGRSDEGLIDPIVKRLGERCRKLYLRSLYRGYLIQWEKWDCALLCGDRVEIVQFAWECFTHHVHIAHLYAGVSNNLATFDDIGRHMITLMSDIQFCESEQAQFQVIHLLDVIGKRDKSYVVGITHLDDLAVDESMLPQLDKTVPYDLILYNSPTLGDLNGELKLLEKQLDHSCITLGTWPNQDDGQREVEKWMMNQHIYLREYPRPQFLGLLKNCRRFITNSSVEYYEAPHFLKPEQIIHVGERNKDRSSRGTLETGASDRVVKILENLYDKK